VDNTACKLLRGEGSGKRLGAGLFGILLAQEGKKKTLQEKGGKARSLNGGRENRAVSKGDRCVKGTQKTAPGDDHSASKKLKRKEKGCGKR